MTLLTNKFIILAVLAFLSGWFVNGWRHDAQVKKAVVKALKQAEKQDNKDLKLAKKELKRVEKIKEETEVILKKVQHAKLNDNTLSPDFIRLFNASL